MPFKIVSSFSDRLKEALDGAPYTELAYRIGMSKQAISSYITGVRNPKRPVVNAIAEELNVNPAWLMGYDEQKYLLQLDEPEIVPYSNDVSNDINDVLAKLTYPQEGLMFFGKPMNDETKRLLKISLENTMKLAIEMDKKNKSE